MARAKKGDTAGARQKPAKTGKEGGSAALDTLKENFSRLSRKDRATFIADPFLWECINDFGKKRDLRKGIDILQKGLETNKRKKDGDAGTGLQGLRRPKKRKTDTKGFDAVDSDSNGDGGTSEDEVTKKPAATKALEKTSKLDSDLKSEIKEVPSSKQLNGLQVENSRDEDLSISAATESKGQSVVPSQLQQVRQPYFGLENRPKWPPGHEQLSGESSPSVKKPLPFLFSATHKSKDQSSMAYGQEQVGGSYFGLENRPKSLSDSGEILAPDLLSGKPQQGDVISTANECKPAVAASDKGLQSDNSVNASLDKMNKTSEVEKVAPTKEWETNPWAITMGVARGYLKKDDDALLESVCIETLRDLQEWQPDLAAKRTFTILNRFENIHNAQPSTEKKDIPSQIQDQVYGLAKATSSDELHRPGLFFWLSQLASTIDEHERTGLLTTVGRSPLSAVYDMYVKAEYPNHEAYEAAKERDPKAVNRKRDAWKRKKETGGKVLRLTKEFGLGVVMCIPTDVTYSRIERMSVGKVELLRHGLKNGPDAQSFRLVCSKTGEWIADFVNRRISAEVFKKRIYKDLQSAISSSGNVINGIKDEHECVEQLNATVRKFPDWMGSTRMGSLGASPTLADMETLAINRDINDEVIRTVLGLKLQQIQSKRTFRVLDPSHFSQAMHEATGLRKLDAQLQCMLIPIHHGHDQHWTLVAVDLEKRKITHMDSSASSGRDADTKRKVIDFLSASNLDSEWKWIAAQVVQQQGRHCAIHVMVNAIALLAGSPLPENVAGLNKRLEYAKYMLAAFWRTYCSNNAAEA